MKLILRYLWRYKFWVLLDAFCASGFALAELGIPTILSNMVDSGVEADNVSILYSRFGWIAAVSILGSLGVILLVFLSNKISNQVGYDIRKDLFHHALQLSPAQIDSFGVSSMITRTGADPYNIIVFVQTILRSAILSPLMLVCTIVLILRLSLKLSLIILATLPAVVIGVIITAKMAKPLSEKQQKSIDSINEILREDLSGIRTIRTFNKEQDQEKKFSAENKLYCQNSSRLYKLIFLTDPLFFFLMNMATLAVYYSASLMLQAGSLQIGQLMAFIEYLFHTMMSCLIFCMVFVYYPKAAVSAARIQEVLDTKPELENKKQAKACRNIGSIEFKDVTFGYDRDHPVLKNISFKAEKGDRIAVIGSTGSGKSTLLKLIARFYDASSGNILINGLDIKDYEINSVRDRMGYVFQKAHLFTRPLKDNIAFAIPQARLSDIKEAARIAQAEDFIEERPEGYESTVSEEGMNLSGGQKQRLSIARAIIKKPDLLLFDDSFSALDFATDAKLRKELQPRLKEAISITVAQRSATIMDADLILVLDQGKLVGMGRHHELLETCSVYREIVLSQMSLEEARRYG